MIDPDERSSRQFWRNKGAPLRCDHIILVVGDYQQQIAKNVTFLVVNYLSAYNTILGRPTLNSWKAATSTYHLMIKFPTKYGVRELQGNQVATHECYVAMMEMNDHLQAMSIEEHRTTTELVEKLEKVFLDNLNHERTTRIGTFASPTVCQAVMAFLRSNRDVFA